MAGRWYGFRGSASDRSPARTAASDPGRDRRPPALAPAGPRGPPADLDAPADVLHGAPHVDRRRLPGVAGGDGHLLDPEAPHHRRNQDLGVEHEIIRVGLEGDGLEEAATVRFHPR